MVPSNRNYQPYLESLDKLGFCTFPVFSETQVEQLLALYRTHFMDKQVVGLNATHNSNPVEQSLAVSLAIKDVVNESLKQVFPDYDYFVGHFMVKAPQAPYEFCLHQDWNIVDETRHKTYQVWIPLQITYPANGGLFVVPESHRFFGNYRSGSYGIPFLADDANIRALSTDVIVPPGNALLYHNGLFHGSYPNRTDDLRIAVIVNYVQKGAPTFYFHKNTAMGRTDLYSITGESLVRNLPSLEKGMVPQGLLPESSVPLCPIDNKTITTADLVAKYAEKVGQKGALQVKQLHIAHKPGLEDELNREGYTVVDLLTEEEVRFFRTEYDRQFGNLDRTPGRFTTLQHTDARQKKRVHDFIVKHVDVPLKRFFSDFIIPVSQFYTKKAHTSGDIDLHADSTLLLNHQLEPHYAVWIPLIDVDAGNGTLCVVPRSHRVRTAFFGGSIGGYHHEHLDWLRRFEVPVALKAGQAVIFDNNLLHNSTANQTGTDRVCFTFRMTHWASQYYSLVAEAEHDNFGVYEEGHDYYMAETWNGDSRHSNGRYRGAIKNSRTRVAKDELEKILGIA